jgi:hypothetical protein
MKPSDKSPEMEDFIRQTFGIDRRKCIEDDICVFCKVEAKVFRDQRSANEFAISGMCQKCQDDTFGA